MFLTFFRFGLVGASGAALNTIVFWLLSRHAPVIVAATFAFELALLSNFALNHHWTFRQQRSGSALQQLLRYQVSAVGGLLVQLVVLHVLVDLGLAPVIANLAGIATAMGWNFTSSVLWTWRSTAVSPALATS